MSRRTGFSVCPHARASLPVARRLPASSCPSSPPLALLLEFHAGTKNPDFGSSPKGRDCSHGLLATCLTWLQAGRPNHHVEGLMSPGQPRVKPALALVNPGEKTEVRVTDAPANA